MVSAGIPLTEVLEWAEALRDDLRPAADVLVYRVADGLLQDKPAGWIPDGDEATELTLSSRGSVPWPRWRRRPTSPRP